MNTYITIGKLTVHISWLSIIVALLLAAILYKLIFHVKLSDWYWNSFFIYFFTWKFSYILFHFQTFWESPFSAIYFSGGTKGHYLGLVFVSFFLLIIAGKKYLSFYGEMIPSFLFFFIFYQGTFAVLTDQLFLLAIQILVLAGFIISLNKWKEMIEQLFILIFLIEVLTQSITSSLLSLTSITFIWLGFIVGILIYFNYIKRVKL